MSVRLLVMPGTYRDSVFLMKLSKDARETYNVHQISAMMGTDRNKELLQESGLGTAEMQKAGPGDLIIAVEADDSEIEQVLEGVRAMLSKKATTASNTATSTTPCALDEAVEIAPDSNLALISTAGDYARYEAAKALEAGMDVMLYSDNISLEDEIALKTLARAKNLLVMGPDCGTAIVQGVPLAFANAVDKGPVGIVGASGTGLQELVCLLDRCGIGISNAYGTGGRDLKDAVGGITALTALERLAADDNTRLLGIIGKPPGLKVREKLAAMIKTIGKKTHVHYLGGDDYSIEEAAGMVPAATVTDMALNMAEALDAKSDRASLLPDTPLPTQHKPGFLRGLFGGGTLCQEAAELAGPILQGEKFANQSIQGYSSITAHETSKGHTFWDLGDDVFTVGRPHPMMAPELRMERLAAELADPTVSVILLDVVIGYGSHEDTAGEIVKTLQHAGYSQGEGKVLVVASVCGTSKDSPNRESQLAKLVQAGVIVLPSNALAAIWAAKAATGCSNGAGQKHLGGCCHV